MQIKMTMSLRQSERPSLKSLQIRNAGEGVEKREASYIVGGNVNWYSHYGEQYRDYSENWYKVAIWHSSPTPGHISRQKYNLKKYCAFLC